MSRPKKVLPFVISVVLTEFQGMVSLLGAALERDGVPRPSVGTMMQIRPCFRVLRTSDQSPVDLLVLPKILLPMILVPLALPVLTILVPLFLTM